eukprot:3477842-Rhodomonas_salina.1
MPGTAVSRCPVLTTWSALSTDVLPVVGIGIRLLPRYRAFDILLFDPRSRPNTARYPPTY